MMCIELALLIGTVDCLCLYGDSLNAQQHYSQNSLVRLVLQFATIVNRLR